MAVLWTPCSGNLTQAEVSERIACRVPLKDGSERGIGKLEREMTEKYRVMPLTSFGTVCDHAVPFMEVVLESAGAMDRVSRMIGNWKAAVDPNQAAAVEHLDMGTGDGAWFGFGISAYSLSAQEDFKGQTLTVNIYDASDDLISSVPFSSSSTGVFVGLDRTVSPHFDVGRVSDSPLFKGLGIFVGHMPGTSKAAQHAQAYRWNPLNKRLDEESNPIPSIELEQGAVSLETYGGIRFSVDVQSKGVAIFPSAKAAFSENIYDGFVVLGVSFPDSYRPKRSLFRRQVHDLRIPMSSFGVLVSASFQNAQQGFTVKWSDARLPQRAGPMRAITQKIRGERMCLMRRSIDGRSAFVGFLKPDGNVPDTSALDRLRDRITAMTTSQMTGPAIVSFNEISGDREVKELDATFADVSDFFSDTDSEVLNRIDNDQNLIAYGGIVLARRVSGNR